VLKLRSPGAAPYSGRGARHDEIGALLCGSWSIGRTENSQAADRDPLAPRWVPNLLALEITAARWPAKDTGGFASSFAT